MTVNQATIITANENSYFEEFALAA